MRLLTGLRRKGGGAERIRSVSSHRRPSQLQHLKAHSCENVTEVKKRH